MADDITDYAITDAMITFGGSFVKQLALAFNVADPINRATLKTAFPHLWEEYTELVRLRRQRQP